MNCLSKDEQTNNSEIVDMVSIAADGPAHIRLMIPSKITREMRVQDVQEVCLGRSKLLQLHDKRKITQTYVKIKQIKGSPILLIMSSEL